MVDLPTPRGKSRQMCLVSAPAMGIFAPFSTARTIFGLESRLPPGLQDPAKINRSSAEAKF